MNHRKNSTLVLKNKLEEVRFSEGVINNRKLIEYLDQAIDEAEKNDSAVYIGSRLYYKIQQYEFANNFQVPASIKQLQASLAGYAGQASSSMT